MQSFVADSHNFKSLILFLWNDRVSPTIIIARYFWRRLRDFKVSVDFKIDIRNIYNKIVYHNLITKILLNMDSAICISALRANETLLSRFLSARFKAQNPCSSLNTH